MAETVVVEGVEPGGAKPGGGGVLSCGMMDVAQCVSTLLHGSILPEALHHRPFT